MRVIAQPGLTVRIAPMGAPELGEPRPCLVHHDPDSLAPWCVVVDDADSPAISAADAAGLAAQAVARGLVVESARYIP